MERIVEKLNARFELAEHEVRTGGSGKWFVYLKKDAIIRRLDSVVPMGWGTKIISSLRTNDRVEVVMEMTIKDITRSYDGVAEDNRRKAKDGKPEVLFPLNTAKAACTDAFKRVASMFGVGLYLQSCDTIQASNEQAASKVFEQWYNKQSDGWANANTIKPIFEKFRAMEFTDGDIIDLANIIDWKDFAGWNKFASAKAAEEAIERGLDRALTEGNTTVIETGIPENDEFAPAPASEYDGSVDLNTFVATFTHIRYFYGDNGRQRYVELATAKPGNGVACVIARGYARSTEFKVMVGETWYDTNRLGDYDGKKRSTSYRKLIHELSLLYKKTEFYNTITGLGKDDVPF